MGQKSGPVKKPAEQVVKEIRRATRRQFTAEEKIRIVLSGLRGEDSIAELCRREGIIQNLPFRWRETGALGMYGWGRPDPACLQHMQRGPHARSSCRRWLCLQRSPRIPTPQTQAQGSRHFWGALSK